ncbi:MAG: AmmeMemoRadiSam system radical SAM enzyme, partial [Candidatus Schekmanbacteria bacterium RBG_16_38_10]
MKNLKKAVLYENLKDDKVKCNLCAHRCIIAPSRKGICGVRENIEGELYSLVYGKTTALNVDPIEKKPLYHFYPGSKALSLATIGCNFKCSFCQNHDISQASKKDWDGKDEKEILPSQIVALAKKYECRSISYTYTEPTIYFEYAYDITQLACKEGLANNFVTNGFMTQEALNTISPYLHAANVDLKCFKEKTYKNVMGGRLQPVLDTLTLMKKLNIWVEVTTLIIPTINDSD